MRVLGRLLRRKTRPRARDRNGLEDIARFAQGSDRVYQDGGNWMWLGSDGIGRIMCPRCWNGGGGTLSRIRMKGVDQVFYLCDECDALWPIDQFDWHNCSRAFEDLSQALEARGLGEWEDA